MFHISSLSNLYKRGDEASFENIFCAYRMEFPLRWVCWVSIYWDWNLRYIKKSPFKFRFCIVVWLNLNLKWTCCWLSSRYARKTFKFFSRNFKGEEFQKKFRKQQLFSKINYLKSHKVRLNSKFWVLISGNLSIHAYDY